MLKWLDSDRFAAGGVTFSIPPPDPRSRAEFMAPAKRAADCGDFFVAKPRWVIESYVNLFGRLRPQHIFELGIYMGGSTALFAEVGNPRRLVAVDNQKRKLRQLEDFVSDRGLESSVRVYEGVDQADTGRIADIADAEFPDEGIDLVIDDCSHQYEATRSSFNELFPRLRAGGMYVIEDWPWAHTPLGDEDEGMFPGHVPLTRLVFELVLAIPGVPNLITEVSINRNFVYVTRGDAPVDRAGFNVAECSNPRGRSLLSPA